MEKWLDNLQNGGRISEFLKSKEIPTSEKQQTVKDKTNIKKPLQRSLKELNVRNKTPEEIAAEREVKIQRSVLAQSADLIGNPKWREALAEETMATGDKFRVSLKPNFFDDYINPMVMIGDMASALGNAPLAAQQSDSYMPYVTAIGTPLVAGAVGGIGAKNTKQFINNMTNPLAGAEDIVKNTKHEIDWGKWNPEIPNNPKLMDEYARIEKTTKSDGTWMKNPDGSDFDGSPEQFIQQNSQNFKKAFPEGYNKVYRGVPSSKNNPDFSKGYQDGDRAIFTADRNLASHYSRGNNILTPFTKESDSGIFELAHPKGNHIDYNTMADDWTEINLSKSSSKEYLESNLQRQEKFLSNLLENYGGEVDDELISYTESRIKQLKGYLDNFDSINNNPEALQQMINTIGSKVSTDDVAKYLPSTDLNNITFRNIIDGGIGDVTIVNNKKGKYLKSLVGNNGMFDMTNPNIYKAIVPVTTGAAALQLNNNNNKLQNGGLIPINENDLQSINANSPGVQFTLEGAQQLFAKEVPQQKKRKPLPKPMNIVDITSDTNRYTKDGGVVVGNFKKVWFDRKPEYYTGKGSPVEGVDFKYVNPQQYKELQSTPEYQKYKYSNAGLSSLKKGGKVIKSSRGQWDFPGENTLIPSNQITMEGVGYPVLGISDTGDTQMMYPNNNYQFNGNEVLEIPINNLSDYISDSNNSSKPTKWLDGITNFTNY